MMTDPYAVLGVSRNATQDEIKKAYRQKAKQYHPDLHPNDSVAAQKFKEVNEAYQLISSGKASYNSNQQNPYGNQYGNPYGYNQQWQQGQQGQYQWGPFGFGRYYTYGQNQDYDGDNNRQGRRQSAGSRVGRIIFAIMMFNLFIFLLRACMFRFW